MNLELTWLNCFWLILPLLLWNIIFGSKITQEQITSDAHSPAWLLGAENIFRLATFILPLLLPLRVMVKVTLPPSVTGVPEPALLLMV